MSTLTICRRLPTKQEVRLLAAVAPYSACFCFYLVVPISVALACAAGLLSVLNVDRKRADYT